MKRLLPLLPLFVAQSWASVTLNFNSASDFTNNFSTGTGSPVIVHSANGGIDNTGSLDLTGLTGTAEFWTLDQSFAGNLANWSASIYFNGRATDAWMFGVYAEPAPGEAFGFPTNDGGVSFPSTLALQTGDASGGAIATLNTVGGSATYGTSVEPGGFSPSNLWYHLEFSATYLGSNEYQTTSTIRNASSDGTLGSVLATATDTLTNADLASDPEVYVFFGFYSDAGSVALDGFTTNAVVPEPSFWGLFVGLSAFGLVARRR